MIDAAASGGGLVEPRPSCVSELVTVLLHFNRNVLVELEFITIQMARLMSRFILALVEAFIPGGDSQSTTLLCKLTRDFHSIPSISCLAKDLRSGEGLQVFIECGLPASHSPAVWTDGGP